MGEVLFDIETNGLLPEMTMVHCIGLADGVDAEPRSYGRGKVSEILSHLEGADTLIGHNIIKFDIPALQKVYPAFKPRGVIRDTLVCTRVIWPEIVDQDFALIRKNPVALPMKLLGRHSLEAWGHRLNCHKGKYDKGWEQWSQEMEDYCRQDIAVTQKLWKTIQSKKYSEECLQLEHDFQDVIFKQEQEGFPFDTANAQLFHAELAAQRAELERQLLPYFPSWVERTAFTPKVNNKTRGYVKGVALVKEKIAQFNPRSGDHIAARLKAQRGWIPSVFTDTNKPKVDGDVLELLGQTWPECKLLAEHHDIQKILSMLAEGKTPWLKVVRNGRIHGEVITGGTVTGRCAHVRPNLGNIPRKGVMGKRCRSLFTAIPGWKLLGADASGLELRGLAHYLQPYDGGAYIDLVLNGDVHSFNQKVMELPTRDSAKTGIYAFIYGAGDLKMGSIIAGDAAAGKRMKGLLLKGIPALSALKYAVTEASKQKGYIRGVDGRIVPVRAVYSALNTLLQSAGAVLVKKATVIMHDEFRKAGLEAHALQVAHIHDEIQLLVRDGYEERVGTIATEAFKKAGEYYAFRCPLAGEYRVGETWRDTH